MNELAKSYLEKIKVAVKTCMTVEQVVDLASVQASWHLMMDIPEVIEDTGFVDDLIGSRTHPSAKPLSSALKSLMEEADLELDDQELWDELGRKFPELHGILIQASVPIKRRSVDGVITYSQGHRRLQWFYGDTYEDAYAHAQAWAEEGVTIDE